MNNFETTLDLNIYVRQQGQTDWQEFDRGPGKFTFAPQQEAGVRLFRVDDGILKTLVDELLPCDSIIFLNLSENRKVTNDGLKILEPLKQLTMLNLSSCDLTNQGLGSLLAFPNLTWLNLSYCNRINDEGLRTIKKIKKLTYLDLQGCVRLTHAGIDRLQHSGLTIHK